MVDNIIHISTLARNKLIIAHII